MKKGFTLIELLVVVLIIAVLTGVALPKYMRSLERARAAEAMSTLKTLNEAVYAYAAGRSGDNTCPPSFRKLLISFPGSKNAAQTTITTRNFVYTINDATAALIPGTDCAGVTAKRTNATRYDYTIWNPYRRTAAGVSASLACFATEPDSIDVCESLGLYTAGLTPYSNGGGVGPGTTEPISGGELGR